MRQHYVNVGILWFVLTFIGELLLPLWNFFPAPASEEGIIAYTAFGLKVRPMKMDLPFEAMRWSTWSGF